MNVSPCVLICSPLSYSFNNVIYDCRYHTLLDTNQSAYENAKKFDKMGIAKQTVDQCHEYGGRFLKQEGAGWIEVADSVARDKVSHAFRTRRAAGAS